VNQPGTFQCNCTIGYTGMTCDAPECSPGICLNGGSCSVANDHWSCSCLQFYEGLFTFIQLRSAVVFVFVRWSLCIAAVAHSSSGVCTVAV
jgi:hypothetical protein